MNQQTLLLDQLRSRGFRSLIQIAGGNMATGLFRAVHPAGDRVVVKVALTEADRQEILLNIQGYGRIRDIGGAHLLPDRLDVLDLEDSPAIVMSDCGADFRHAVHGFEDPVEAYVLLVKCAMDIYRTTIVPESSEQVLSRLRDRILTALAEEPLCRLIQQVDVEALHACRLDHLLPARSCFSDFNFTPANVFLVNERIRYIDPSADVVGIPIIDLACFAGVADAHALPGHTEGASLLHTFATQGALLDLLGMTEAQARRVYRLGRVLQTAYSAKFRIQKTPDVGRRLMRECVEHLQVFVRSESEEVSGE